MINILLIVLAVIVTVFIYGYIKLKCAQKQALQLCTNLCKTLYNITFITADGVIRKYARKRKIGDCINYIDIMEDEAAKTKSKVLNTTLRNFDAYKFINEFIDNTCTRLNSIKNSKGTTRLSKDIITTIIDDLNSINVNEEVCNDKSSPL